MATTVMELLQQKLEERKKYIVESLGTGVAKDYAEYRDLCGVIRGLTTAIREIEDLSRNYMDGEDD